MTYKEWMREHHPYAVDPVNIPGRYGCPGGHIDGAPVAHGETCRALNGCCKDCWAQELPEPEKPAAEDKPRKVVFLSGPITGVSQYWKAFEKAMDELAGRYIVLNPAQLSHGMTNGDYTRICLAMIDCADAVFMLPGWENSKGANLEAQYCEYIGKPWTSSKARLEEVLR